MTRPEITASSIVLGLIVLLISCIEANAAEVFIDVWSPRPLPSFRAMGAPPHEPWGHEMAITEVESLGLERWRIRTSYPDRWGCALFMVREIFPGTQPADPPFAVMSENAIEFGTCPNPPLEPVSEPPADLMAAVGLGATAALVAWRRHGQPRA